MLAHGPLSAIGEKIISKGNLLRAVDCRANWLVDSLAKLRAVQGPKSIMGLLDGCRAMVRQSVALLGVVNHAASNFEQSAQLPDGSLGARDAPSNHRVGERKPHK